MDRLRLTFATVILLAWVISSFVLDPVFPDYDPPAALTPLMLLVAGYLFGPSITGRSHKAREENGP